MRTASVLGRAPAALALAVLACAWPASAAAAPSTAKTLTEREGVVSATISYQQGADGFGNATYAALRLTIDRGGVSFYEQPVTSSACEPCGLEEFPEAPVPLAVADLEGTGEPDVLLHLYTGGGHCCSILQIFAFDAGTKTYRLIEHDFFDPGVTVVDLAGDRRLELESADDRFAYRFTSFAYSGLPLQVLKLTDGALVDVTAQFPAAVALDAREQLKRFLAYRRRPRPGIPGRLGGGSGAAGTRAHRRGHTGP